MSAPVDHPTLSRMLKITMTETDDDRDRPTQPNSEAPVDVDHGFGQLPRLPRLPSIAPDPNSWEHRQLAILVEAVGEIKEARKALDADALLSRQTEIFASIVADRYEMIREQLVTKVGELGKRVDAHDTRLDTDGDRLEKIELELAALRTQMSRVEQLRAQQLEQTRAHIDALESQLASLREGQHAAAAATQAAPPKLEPTAGG